ncbi:MAG: molybdopterin-dependent oxidoreductase [Adlercreutzia equolifaciens]
MEEKEQFAPTEIVKDGKVTRRTFVKGAGWLTITSAIGASALGCAPSKQAAEEEPLAETGPVADPEEGFTYKSACCSVNCTSRCHLRACVKDDKIYTVTPGQMPGRDDYANCCLRSIGLGTRTHDESVRVMHPMKRTGERGSGEFEQITWEQAIDEITERMEATKAQYGPKACGFYSFTGNLSKLSWEAPTRFAGTYGATAFDIEGIMGDHGATMGMTLCFGQGRGAHDTRDYMNSKMVVLWGRNVADTHTSEFRYLVKARENGAKIVVVDPRLCSTAAIADQWIPIKAQTDPALALGMMNVIISKDLHAKDWLVANSVAPFLVRESDGALLRDGEGEDAAWMVWDTAANQAVPNTTEGVTAALSGTFEVNGEACRTAFDHLCDEVSKYTLEYTSEITGLDPEVIETFAMDYINAQPAGIRMGQGMQRVYNSHSPFRTVATLAAVAGYIGVEGGGASHAGGTASIRSTPGVTIPAFNYDEWADTGANEVNMVKSSTLYDQIITKDPNPIDFMWFANSNFINMSPDANKIINEVLPNISTIVTVDPYWTWTAKYSDYVLPACNYWVKWTSSIARPVFFQSSGRRRLARASPTSRSCRFSRPRWARAICGRRPTRNGARSFVNEEHPAWEGFDFDKAVEEGIWGRPDGIYDSQIVFADGVFPTPSTKFTFYNDDLVEFEEEVPCYKPMLEDPKGPLGEKQFGSCFCSVSYDRMNVHTQHIGIPALAGIQDEPRLEMNPVDAKTRGIADGDVVSIVNDRGACKMKVFVTEGIVPGTVATQSGWTPDYTIEGNYQTLHPPLTLNPTEGAFPQTCTAFYDVLVEAEKA